VLSCEQTDRLVPTVYLRLNQALNFRSIRRYTFCKGTFV